MYTRALSRANSSSVSIRNIGSAICRKSTEASRKNTRGRPPANRNITTTTTTTTTTSTTTISHSYKYGKSSSPPPPVLFKCKQTNNNNNNNCRNNKRKKNHRYTVDDIDNNNDDSLDDNDDEQDEDYYYDKSPPKLKRMSSLPGGERCSSVSSSCYESSSNSVVEDCQHNNNNNNNDNDNDNITGNRQETCIDGKYYCSNDNVRERKRKRKSRRSYFQAKKKKNNQTKINEPSDFSANIITNNNNFKPICNGSVVDDNTTVQDDMPPTTNTKDVDNQTSSAARNKQNKGDPTVKPIFVWVQQSDTKIIKVLCEDYDRRNRIKLTKTASGWRSTPLSDHLSRQVSSDVEDHHRSSIPYYMSQQCQASILVTPSSDCNQPLDTSSNETKKEIQIGCKPPVVQSSSKIDDDDLIQTSSSIKNIKSILESNSNDDNGECNINAVDDDNIIDSCNINNNDDIFNDKEDYNIINTTIVNGNNIFNEEENNDHKIIDSCNVDNINVSSDSDGDNNKNANNSNNDNTDDDDDDNNDNKTNDNNNNEGIYTVYELVEEKRTGQETETDNIFSDENDDESISELIEKIQTGSLEDDLDETDKQILSAGNDDIALRNISNCNSYNFSNIKNEKHNNNDNLLLQETYPNEVVHKTFSSNHAESHLNLNLDEFSIPTLHQIGCNNEHSNLNDLSIEECSLNTTVQNSESNDFLVSCNQQIENDVQLLSCATASNKTTFLNDSDRHADAEVYYENNLNLSEDLHDTSIQREMEKFSDEKTSISVVEESITNYNNKVNTADNDEANTLDNDETNTLDNDQANALHDQANALDDQANALDDQANVLDDQANTLDDQVNTLDDQVNALDDEANALYDEANIADNDEANTIDNIEANTLDNDLANILDEDGANILYEDGANILDEDEANILDEDEANILDEDGANILDEDGVNTLYNDGANALYNDGANALDNYKANTLNNAEGNTLKDGEVNTSGNEEDLYTNESEMDHNIGKVYAESETSDKNKDYLTDTTTFSSHEIEKEITEPANQNLNYNEIQTLDEEETNKLQNFENTLNPTKFNEEVSLRDTKTNDIYKIEAESIDVYIPITCNVKNVTKSKSILLKKNAEEVDNKPLESAKILTVLDISCDNNINNNDDDNSSNNDNNNNKRNNKNNGQQFDDKFTTLSNENDEDLCDTMLAYAKHIMTTASDDEIQSPKEELIDKKCYSNEYCMDDILLTCNAEENTVIINDKSHDNSLQIQENDETVVDTHFINNNVDNKSHEDHSSINKNEESEVWQKNSAALKADFPVHELISADKIKQENLQENESTENFDNFIDKSQKCTHNISVFNDFKNNEIVKAKNENNPAVLCTPLCQSLKPYRPDGIVSDSSNSTRRRERKVRRPMRAYIVEEDSIEILSDDESAHNSLPVSNKIVNVNLVQDKQRLLKMNNKQQDEPLDLGMSKKKDSTTSNNRSDGPTEQKEKPLGMTVHKLPTETTNELKHIPHSNKRRIPKEEVKDPLEIEVEKKKSRLMDLLTCSPADKKPYESLLTADPLEQLKDVLSNPNFTVPDPLLVPRARLPALVANPAKEIPRLLSRKFQNVSYTAILGEPDLLVVSLSHLQRLLKKQVNEEEILKYHKQAEQMRSQMNSGNLNYVSYIPVASDSTDLNSLFLLPYLNQLNNPALPAYHHKNTNELLTSMLNYMMPPVPTPPPPSNPHPQSVPSNMNSSYQNPTNPPINPYNLGIQMEYQKSNNFWQEMALHNPNLYQYELNNNNISAAGSKYHFSQKDNINEPFHSQLNSNKSSARSFTSSKTATQSKMSTQPFYSTSDKLSSISPSSNFSSETYSGKIKEPSNSAYHRRTSSGNVNSFINDSCKRNCSTPMPMTTTMDYGDYRSSVNRRNCSTPGPTAAVNCYNGNNVNKKNYSPSLQSTVGTDYFNNYMSGANNQRKCSTPIPGNTFDYQVNRTNKNNSSITSAAGNLDYLSYLNNKQSYSTSIPASMSDYQTYINNGSGCQRNLSIPVSPSLAEHHNSSNSSRKTCSTPKPPSTNEYTNHLNNNRRNCSTPISTPANSLLNNTSKNNKKNCSTPLPSLNTWPYYDQSIFHPSVPLSMPTLPSHASSIQGKVFNDVDILSHTSVPIDFHIQQGATTSKKGSVTDENDAGSSFLSSTRRKNDSATYANHTSSIAMDTSGKSSNGIMWMADSALTSSKDAIKPSSSSSSKTHQLASNKTVTSQDSTSHPSTPKIKVKQYLVDPTLKHQMLSMDAHIDQQINGLTAPPDGPNLWHPLFNSGKGKNEGMKWKWTTPVVTTSAGRN